ncbi:MAG: pyrroline-5-carboxylate reductase [Dehalococcoidia bacterium]|nr:pyrroline-5-carboxylate reductase [Dehalococcoidia bacterium]MQG16294.1 pyrroline-5-carboxylate reductase [SAR202 cluster bacterium]|tara:strand:- start:3235 stop:4041 length:807 start_codon:yes stop_codon:yes gene_type:complete
MIISFIGGGAMCEAIVQGILSAKSANCADILIAEPNEERRVKLKKQYGIKTTPNNTDAIHNNADIIVLSIKPQVLAAVTHELKDLLKPQQLLLSIVAGAKLDTIIKSTNHDSVIRVMPNTPAQIGAGVSVWTATPAVDGEKKEMTAELLNPLGIEIYVEDESMIDMSTALSGSGPAYLFAFVESLIEAGISLGMSKELSNELVIHTVLGSSKMLNQTGMDPSELRNLVTSPGGTTSAALSKLNEEGFSQSLIMAVKSAYKRSIELGKL